MLKVQIQLMKIIGTIIYSFFGSEILPDVEVDNDWSWVSFGPKIS